MMLDTDQLYEQIDFLRERLKQADLELQRLNTYLSSLLGDKDAQRPRTDPGGTH